MNSLKDVCNTNLKQYSHLFDSGFVKVKASEFSGKAPGLWGQTSGLCGKAPGLSGQASGLNGLEAILYGLNTGIIQHEAVTQIVVEETQNK